MGPGNAAEAVVVEAGTEQWLARLRAAAGEPGFGPERVAAILAAAVADGPDPLPPTLLRRDPTADWVLTPLHRADEGTWSVLAAVFAPGVRAPVHNHGAWAVIGIVRGRERETRSRRRDSAGLEVDRVLINPAAAVSVVRDGVIHTVEALDGRDAVSIHVYGTDIVTQPRHTYDEETGAASPFRPPFAGPAAR